MRPMRSCDAGIGHLPCSGAPATDMRDADLPLMRRRRRRPTGTHAYARFRSPLLTFVLSSAISMGPSENSPALAFSVSPRK